MALDVYRKGYKVVRNPFFPSGVLSLDEINGSCGATDNASDYGSEDSRFESWQDRL